LIACGKIWQEYIFSGRFLYRSGARGMQGLFLQGTGGSEKYFDSGNILYRRTKKYGETWLAG
jgi:hypothetical protein